MYHCRYFYVLDGDDLTTDEIKGPRSRNVVAHDGWVMDDPLENFVDQKSMVILLQYACTTF